MSAWDKLWEINEPVTNYHLNGEKLSLGYSLQHRHWVEAIKEEGDRMQRSLEAIKQHVHDVDYNPSSSAYQIHGNPHWIRLKEIMAGIIE